MSNDVCVLKGTGKASNFGYFSGMDAKLESRAKRFRNMKHLYGRVPLTVGCRSCFCSLCTKKKLDGDEVCRCDSLG